MKFVQFGYAVKDAKCTMSHDDINKIDLTVFDENDPEQHIIKLLFICGIFFGFRGESEHTGLECRRLTSGVFPVGHKWAGCQWFGIDFLIDKSNKLSIHRPYVRSIEDTQMKVPVIGNDPKATDPGGCIKRFLEKLSPGQTRLYCKVVPKEYRRTGEDRLFYSNQPMGKDSIKALFKKGAMLMGLSNPEELAPHSLRHLFSNQIACDPSISLKECMLALRHSSASATVNYQKRNMKSEENRLKCLGFKPPPETRISPEVVYRANDDEADEDSIKQDDLIDLQKVQEYDTNLTSEDHMSSELYSTELALSQQASFTHTQDDLYHDSGSYVRRLENVHSTQAAIDIVKEDVKALESETFMIENEKSSERRQIVYLGKQVRDLRQKCNMMAKKLYYYEEKKRRGELIIKSSRDAVFPNPKRRMISPPLNPYSKMKTER